MYLLPLNRINIKKSTDLKYRKMLEINYANLITKCKFQIYFLDRIILRTCAKYNTKSFIKQRLWYGRREYNRLAQ